MKFSRKALSQYRSSPNDFAKSLFAPLPARYDLLAEVLSFGQDRRWRSAMVDRVAGSGPQLVLDVACGPCAVTRRLAKKTTARIVGLDLSEDMLRVGQDNVENAGLSDRVALVLGRGEQLPFADATFDANGKIVISAEAHHALDKYLELVPEGPTLQT